MFTVPNHYRDTKTPSLKSDDSYGNNGFFVIPHFRINNYQLRVQASDGEGWEHVSVSVAEVRRHAHRCPTWEEMCWIKDLFWSQEDCVVQYHSPKSEYVNMHPFVLHLWKPVNQEYVTPPKIMVIV